MQVSSSNSQKNVNNGTGFSGTTVFLDADLDFSGGLSEQFEPIGKDYNRYFQGTFDGQGRIISNLAMNFSSEYVGLFGYSTATIRNVVLDSSCSVVSSYSDSSSVQVGGINGFFNDCVIENNVNMARISFTGSAGYYLYIGGIVGRLSVSNKGIVRNCANYGCYTLWEI